MKTKQLTTCALFICLICVGTFIRIPAPLAPVTLQLPMVILCGMLLKSKNGVICTVLYVFMGLIGLPVFVGGGGFSYILQPTFGYILAFIPCAFVVGKICKNKNSSFKKLFTAGLSGVIIVHITGFIYFIFISHFYLGNGIDLKSLFMSLCLVALPKDIIMCTLAAIISGRVERIL